MAWKLCKYTNGEELHKKAQAYVEFCQNQTRDNLLNGVKMPIVAPNVAGLARWLGVTRQTVNNYIHKPQQYPQLREALQVFLDAVEDNFIQYGVNGSKFAEFYLQRQYNRQYQDKQLVEHSTTESEASRKAIEQAKQELIEVDDDLR